MTAEQLKLLLKEGEGLGVEFKERFSSRIAKDIVAFANTKGGSILLGVDDNGKVIGEKVTNRLKAEISGIARNCEPAITIKKISQIGKVVVIEIDEGSEKPYSCSEGYFRRLDAVTQKMNRKEIELFFRYAIKTSFELLEHLDATWRNISQKKIRTFFEEAGIDMLAIDEKKVLASLGMSDGKHINNAGVLFFAKEPRKLLMQCELILVAFKGTKGINVYDKKYIQDDLLTQFNEAIIFLERHLNVRSEIKGVNRKDICELSMEALREAVANAIIHRDYSMRGTSIMVEVHEDRVEVRNPGGLPEGLTIKGLQNVSIRRNEIIADMFARMEKVERMGTGIKRMRDAMKAYGLPYPKIKSDTFFGITFQRPPYSLREEEKGGQKVVRTGGQKQWSDLTSRQDEVLKLIADNPDISRKELSDKLGINPSAIQKHMEVLKVKKIIKRIGSAKGGHWEILST